MITPVTSNQVVVPITALPMATTTLPDPTVTSTVPKPGQLPTTGSNIVTTLRTVVTLTLLGVALIIISRRRRSTVN